jgi:hypothetical protein
MDWFWITVSLGFVLYLGRAYNPVYKELNAGLSLSLAFLCHPER